MVLAKVPVVVGVRAHLEPENAAINLYAESAVVEPDTDRTEPIHLLEMKGRMRGIDLQQLEILVARSRMVSGRAW